MKMYDLYDLLIELMPFFIITVAITVLSRIFDIVKHTMRGCYIADMAEELMKENEKLIREKETKTTNIDEDMKKYFNYKE